MRNKSIDGWTGMLDPKMGGAEAEFLKAFDDARELIYQTAAKVYARGQKKSVRL